MKNSNTPTKKLPFDICLPATVETPAKLVETIEVEVYENFGEEFLTAESSELIERTRAHHSESCMDCDSLFKYGYSDGLCDRHKQIKNTIPMNNNDTPTPRTDAAYFKDCATMYDLAGEMKLMERELAAVTKERDELALACRKLMKIIGAPDGTPDEWWATDDEINEAYSSGQAALLSIDSIEPKQPTP